jgi:hypothetical protein
MKRLFYITTLIIVLASCTKKIEDTTPVVNTLPDVPAVDGGPVWTSLPVPSNNPLNDPTGNNIIIPVNGTVFCVLGGTSNSRVYKLNAATTRWELFTSIDITVDNSKYLFSHGTKIYWGFFRNSTGHINSFSSVDIVTGVKTVLPQFPGVFVDGATTFVIGDKGYLLGGYSLDDHTVNQHWEYNFLTNQWTNKGNSPLGARSSSSAFVVGNRAYIGLGFGFTYINGFRTTVYKKDWISYTPGSIFYGIMTDFPTEGRAGAKGFVVDGLPYVGFGRGITDNFTDLWRYNIASNSWTQQTSWPGTGGSTMGTFAFNNTGYLVKGGINQFWSYGN